MLVSYTILVRFVGLKRFYIVMYIYNKGSIAGSTLKMPFIGPFLESMDPKFEEYNAKWMSGPLSCVSIFHKCVSTLSIFPDGTALTVRLGL